MRRAAAASVAAALVCPLVVGALAGCTAAPRPARLPAGVTADVKQYRSDYGPRILELRITAGRTAITVTRASLASPSLASPAVWTGSTRIGRGMTVDLRAPLPDAACGDGTAPEPRMTLRFRLADGRTGTAELAATQSIGDLDRIRALDCADDRVRAIAPLEGATLTIEGEGADSVAVLDIVATPTGGAAPVGGAASAGGYELVDARSTVLLAPAASTATSWPLSAAVTASGAPVTVPIRIVPTRCDAHVIAEDKVGTILPLDVRFDDGTTGHLDLPLADGLKGRLLAFVASHCGLTG